MTETPNSNGELLEEQLRPRRMNDEEETFWRTNVEPLLISAYPWLIRAISGTPIVSHPRLDAPTGIDRKGRVYINFHRIKSDDITDEELTARLALDYIIAVWRLLTADEKRAGNIVYQTPEVRKIWDIASTATAATPMIDCVTNKNSAFVGSIAHAAELKSKELLSVKELQDALSSANIGIELSDDIQTEKLFALLMEIFGQGQGQGQDRGQDGQGQGDDDGSGNSGGSPFSPGCIQVSETDELEADQQGIQSLSQSQQNDLREQVAQDARDHAQRGVGNALPDSVTEWSAETLAEEVIDPLIFFNTTVGGTLDTRMNGTHPTYARRSRRQSAMNSNIILQGKARELQELFIGVDVSGSMGDSDLILALSAVQQLGDERGFDIYYFSVSTMPHGIKKLEPGDKPILDRDQAGTDMRVAFDLFNIYGAKTRMVITDSYTPWPTDPEPGTTTIIAIPTYTEEDYEERAKAVPSFLQCVRLPMEKLEEKQKRRYDW